MCSYLRSCLSVHWRGMEILLSVVSRPPTYPLAAEVERRCRSGTDSFDVVEEPRGDGPPDEGAEMRVMVIVKANEDSEAGVMPSQELLTEMGKFNEELVKAGVMLAGEGLHPSSKGKRVRFAGGKRTVIDGPFTEAKELVAGFWIWQVKSMDEAVEWLKRAPFDGGAEIELRPIFEEADFLEALG